MGVLLKREHGAYILSRIGRFSLVIFFVSMAVALFNSIWSIYIDSFVHSSALVGLISAALTIIPLLSFFLIIPLVEKYGKTSLYLLVLILYPIIYFLFGINKTFGIFLTLAFFIAVVDTIRITCAGIIIKSISPKKELSRNEGLVYTFFNLAFLIGPLIAGLISLESGFGLVFFLSSFFSVLALISFKISKLKVVHIKRKLDINPFKNFLDFFKNRDRVNIYILGGGVYMWWTLIYIFVPLMITKAGLDYSWVGYFLFAAAIPMILLDYSFGKLAGKIGFKKVFKIGFLIASILSFSCFFISNIYWIMGLLVFAGIGLAMLESTTESYFFDTLKGKQDLKFYGPYNTTIDINHLIGRALCGVILLFFSLNYLFLFFGAVMLIMFLVSFRIRNMIELKKGRRFEAEDIEREIDVD